MAISIVMPALGLAQESGKVLAWRKKEGEAVAKGEPLLEVETDKAVVEIEAPADGVLAGVKAEAGSVIAVGKTIAWIVNPGEVPPAEAVLLGDAGRDATSAPSSISRRASAPEPSSTTVKISPKARRLAREHGIEVSRVRGSGSEGEIRAADVLALVESQAAGGAAGLETLSTIGRLMAERTTQSWTSVPHFFVAREMDAGALVEARERLGAVVERSHGIRPTHTDFLVALLAPLLRRHPRMNASWTEEGIRLHPEINIAVAIAVRDGVVAAVIRNADAADLGAIAVQRRELAERAKAGRLHPADIACATFTISNLGMYNVDAFTAVINPPQAAILAVGRITDRVVAVQGHPDIRPMMTLTLSCDHRVVDGARAAAFLNDLAEAIREPEQRLRIGGSN